MIGIRRIRYWGWLLRALLAKYRRSLIAGFLVGFVSVVAMERLAPWVTYQWFTKARHIAIIGEFTPTNLPLSIQRNLSYGLTAVNEQGAADPALSVAWEATESGKLYTFHLRSGAVWHTGKPVGAADVNYNIRGVTFNAIDDQTLQAKLATAYSPFPLLVAKPIFHTGLRGFGPYKVGAIRLKGDTVQFLKLVPALDQTLPVLSYRFYQTEALAILAFKRGDVDEIEELGNAQAFANWKGVTTTEGTNYQRIITLFFNLANERLKDKSFRQALGYALPQNLPGERAYSPLSKKSWGYSDKVRMFQADPAQVKRLLGDVSKSNEASSAALTITTFPNFLDVAQTITDSWTAAGITTKIQVTNSVSDNFEVLLSAQDVPPDPDQYPFWHSTQMATNITRYTNVKIDKLLEDGRQELDEAKRKVIYAEFQRYLVDDAPAIFLYYPKTYTVKRGKEK